MERLLYYPTSQEEASTAVKYNTPNINGNRLFDRAHCDRTRGKVFKPKEGSFRPDLRKKFFTMRVVKHWSRLPGGMADAPSLETFSGRLDRALSNVI